MTRGDSLQPYQSRVLRYVPRRLRADPTVLELMRTARTSVAQRKVRRLVPPIPSDAILPLEEASDVLLIRSRSPWHFSEQAYAQEHAFAIELAARGRRFALTDQAWQIFDKSVAWFLPDNFVAPALWDYSLQMRQFVAGLEAQGNRVFCSSDEAAYWENKVHMHRALDAIGAPTPRTLIVGEDRTGVGALDFEPVLVKEEHSSGSAGIHHLSSAASARDFIAGYTFRGGEHLLVQKLVRGATRDLRLTMVGATYVPSCSYWRTKSAEALASPEWTTTATTYNSTVSHGDVPAGVVPFIADVLDKLKVRTAGVDLMWEDDDVSGPPLILELSPIYQPNPPKPERYAHLSYKQFKADRFAADGYLAGQFQAFRDIAAQILDQGLF